MSAKTLAISAPRLFDGQALRESHCVIVDGGIVADVMPTSDLPAGCELTELHTGTLSPGLVDLQVNGGGGFMFHDHPDMPTLTAIVAAHAARGTTSLLPTVISDSMSTLQQAAQTTLDCITDAVPGVAGLHIEGPFFAGARRGVHAQKFLRRPESDDIDWLCSLGGMPLLLTIAPELFEARDIRRLSNSGIKLAAGHSDATCEEMAQAAQAGLHGVTHLYNAMSQLTGRAPGVTGAALDDGALWTSIIADGHHVHDAALRIAWRCKGADRLILVSDAMATVGARTNTFTLYDETITAADGRLINSEGKLAGSAISLLDAVGYAHRVAGIPLHDCLQMATSTPAKALGLEQTVGCLRKGARADLLHLDDELQLGAVWLAGERLDKQLKQPAVEPGQV